MALIKTISKLNQTKLTLKTPITGASPKFAPSPDPAGPNLNPPKNYGHFSKLAFQQLPRHFQE